MRNDLILSNWNIKSSSDTFADDFLESIFFIGNGRFGVRGYLPFEDELRPIQKGLFLAGAFGEIKSGITDFINLPTTVYEKLYIDGSLAKLSSKIERNLDLHTAVLNTSFTLTAHNKKAEIEYTRFTPYNHPMLFVQRTKIRLNEKSNIKLISGIENASCNCTIPDDQTKTNFETIHLASLKDYSFKDNCICSSYITKGTNIEINENILFSNNGKDIKDDDTICKEFIYKDSDSIIIDKLTYISSSRDVDSNKETMPSVIDFDSLYKEHIQAWEHIWNKCDIKLKDEELTTALRYSMYELFASCSRKDNTVSIGARGLTHSRYKGCYFWDTDLFMLPFFLKNDTEAAKNLCMYRINNLEAAKAHAKKMNNKGARFPWMASFDGSEQCESWDIGCSELHITADVAYSIDQYYKTTKDETFYIQYAAELFIETARFWVSRYSFDRKNKNADLLWCKGPDEYCGATINNLYTNVMVQNNLDLAIKAAENLKKKDINKYNILNISDEEIDDWKLLKSIIKWPHDPNTGRLTTDELFHKLEEVDIKDIKKSLGASYHDFCFDRLQRFKLVKQADVLLLMTRLPDLFTNKEKIDAWNDFEPICLHDSTLSFASHALFALENNLEKEGKEYLRKALLLDLRDIMGNTGKEGLHLACMGEAWNAVTNSKISL